MKKNIVGLLLLTSAAAALTLVACTAKETNDPGPLEPAAAGGFDGIDEVGGNLTALVNPCSYVVGADGGGTMTVKLTPGEFTIIGRTAPGVMTANGTACGTATVAAVKKIDIYSLDAGAESVILDYLNGPFALGNAAGPGIFIDLKGGGDTVKIRGSNGPDTFLASTKTPGANGTGTYYLSLNINDAGVDAFPDVSIINITSLVVSTGPGADILNGSPPAQSDGGVVFAFGYTTDGGTRPAFQAYGGDDNDTITAGLGNDTLNGGAGDDTFLMGSVAAGKYTVVGGPGLDTVDFSKRTTNLTVTLGAGAVSGAASEELTIDKTVEVVKSGSGNDTLTCALDVACQLFGGTGNDVLTGSLLNDTLNCGSLADGGIENDTVSYLTATRGVAVTLGTAGAATTANGMTTVLLADAGEQLLEDGGVEFPVETDTITGCRNVVGSPFNDTITGNELDNIITGGAGDDTLNGGDGNDTFMMGTASDGADTITGGLGEDTVDYSGRSVALVCVMDGEALCGESGEGDLIGTTVENLICGTAACDITGNAGNNKLTGGDGDDILTGLGGNDELTGGKGADTLNGGAGDDILDPGPGANIVSCGTGNDVLLPATGGGSNDNSAANDCPP